MSSGTRVYSEVREWMEQRSRHIVYHILGLLSSWVMGCERRWSCARGARGEEVVGEEKADSSLRSE